MTIIKPTIGRVVLFNAAVGDPFFLNPGPHASLITYVHSDALVNLATFNESGKTEGRTSVRLLQAHEEAPSTGYYCEWMTYQLGQAAKYEALEKKVEPTVNEPTPALNEPKLTLDEAKEVLKSAPAPRVTEESIKAKIARIEYLNREQLTICVITMQNGWVSVGTSKPASAANYNQEVGERYAYDNAFKPLWQLEGYLLVDMLYRASIGG